MFDTFTGHTYVKTNSTIVAYDLAGGEINRQPYPEAALGASRDYPLLQGLSGGLYTVIDDGSGWPYQNRQKLIGFDGGLAPLCYNSADGSYGPILAYGGSIVGDQNAVYGSFGSQITRFDLNCSAQRSSIQLTHSRLCWWELIRDICLLSNMFRH